MVLTPNEVDAIGEILNLGLSRASTALVELVRDDITVHVPSIAILPVQDIDTWIHAKSTLRAAAVPVSNPAALLRFRGPLAGTLALVFPFESAVRLASALRVEPSPAGLQEVVEETANLLLNAVAGSIANRLGCELFFDTPCYTDAATVIAGLNRDPHFPTQLLFAQACFNLAESTIEGQILLHLDGNATFSLTAAIDAMASRSRSPVN